MRSECILFQVKIYVPFSMALEMYLKSYEHLPCMVITRLIGHSSFVATPVLLPTRPGCSLSF